MTAFWRLVYVLDLLEQELPSWRIPRLVRQQLRARDRDVAAGLADVNQLRGRLPGALRLAHDFHAGNTLQPGADLHVAAGCILQLGQVPGLARVVLAVLQAHARCQRVEAAVGFQQAEHPLQEQGQVFRVGEAAVDVRDDLECPELVARVLPQALAVEVAQVVFPDPHGLLPPLLRPAVLYGERDRARLAAGRRVVGRVVVQYGVAAASADIQPAVSAAQAPQRGAEAGGQEFHVGRERAVGDVAAGNFGSPAAEDLFLLREFLVDARLGRNVAG